VKLFWYDRPDGNLGDDLNPWLWPRLLPGLIDGEGAWLVGIGTLLNERLPPEGELVILGAGAGLGERPVVDARWRVFGVRGPLTAQALGLPPELAVGDPAILAADFVAPARERRGVGFMPHYISMPDWDWRRTAEGMGLVFVDPQAPVDETLAQIAGLESLISEAMHGVIVADALRTPWVGLGIDPDFYDWKWRDWGLSVGVEPVIHRLPSLSDAALSPRNALKRLALLLGANVTPPPPPRSTPLTIERANAALCVLAERAPRQLSTDAAIAAAKARVRRAVERLRAEGPKVSAAVRP